MCLILRLITRRRALLGCIIVNQINQLLWLKLSRLVKGLLLVSSTIGVGTPRIKWAICFFFKTMGFHLDQIDVVDIDDFLLGSEISC